MYLSLGIDLHVIVMMIVIVRRFDLSIISEHLRSQNLGVLQIQYISAITTTYRY